VVNCFFVKITPMVLQLKYSDITVFGPSLLPNSNASPFKSTNLESFPKFQYGTFGVEHMFGMLVNSVRYAMKNKSKLIFKLLETVIIILCGCCLGSLLLWSINSFYWPKNAWKKDRRFYLKDYRTYLRYWI